MALRVLRKYSRAQNFSIWCTYKHVCKSWRRPWTLKNYLLLDELDKFKSALTFSWVGELNRYSEYPHRKLPHIKRQSSWPILCSQRLLRPYEESFEHWNFYFYPLPKGSWSAHVLYQSIGPPDTETLMRVFNRFASKICAHINLRATAT